MIKKYVQLELDLEPVVGYSVGKWSDDDDWGLIVPFFGDNI
jgi:hypothetical protein